MSGLLRVIFLLFLSTALHASERDLSSGKTQKVLLELYTSEGCSSCPPMERYLNDFISNDALWNSYIPVAFHVDYWDYIGWEDRFAAPEYAQRQRQHAREGNVSAVYTPALIVNGRGWRPGVFNTAPEADTHAAGNLRVHIDPPALSADFEPLDDRAAGFDLHIALLGMDLESRITAGENQGRTAQHEFVVIGFKTLQGNGHWQTSLPEPHDPHILPRAFAVWVTPAGSLKPLQAVGGPLSSDVKPRH